MSLINFLLKKKTINKNNKKIQRKVNNWRINTFLENLPDQFTIMIFFK